MKLDVYDMFSFMPDKTSSIRRHGPFLFFRDCEGLRHVVRASSVQLVSDADPVADTVILPVAK